MSGVAEHRRRTRTWEVAVGPREHPRYFHVPDEGLQGFLRSLASRGISEVQISNGRSVFRINRLSPPPDAEP